MKLVHAALIPAKKFNYPTNEQDLKIIEEHADKLLEFYDVIAMELATEHRKLEAQFLEDRACFEAKECSYCGGTLYKRNEWDYYYECEHKDTVAGNHTKLTENQAKYMKRVRLPENNLLAAILKRTGLTGKIKHGVLYSFLMSRGREDLHLKYGYSSMQSKINGFKDAKQRSLEQERRAYEHLKQQYKVVIPQQNIEYRIEGENTKFCIPDFICSNLKDVVVVDAKLFNIDDNKMDLYVACVEFILRSHGDNRKVSGAFIVYSSDAQYMQSKKHGTICLG